MKAYLINLDKNPERLAFMRGQLERLGIDFVRYPAVYGKTLTIEERKQGFSTLRSFIASKKKMSDAEIGVAMSHCGVYREFLKESDETALVFEDDVEIRPQFKEVLKHAEGFINLKVPQVIVFSGYGIDGGETANPEIKRERSIWCADAYLINRKAAELILKANWPVITVADSFKRWSRRFGLELYRAFPISVKQDDVTFKSENKVLPKSNWIVRNVCWVADFVLSKVCGR